MDPQHDLSRRERQIMDILFADGEASPGQIAERLPDPPTPTAVRTMLKILQAKGYIKRRKQGREYLYSSQSRREQAGRSALDRVIQTFFDGSLGKAVGAHLAEHKGNLSEEELKRLARMIREARRDQR